MISRLGTYDIMISSQARVHPQLLRQGCQQIYLVSNEMLERVWIRLRDSQSSLDSSTSESLLEVTSEYWYAAHFYDMYVDRHTGKHLTGDRIRILLLNLPFLFRDLIAPEVM
jgi:hypothetical protein